MNRKRRLSAELFGYLEQTIIMQLSVLQAVKEQQGMRLLCFLLRVVDFCLANQKLNMVMQRPLWNFIPLNKRRQSANLILRAPIILIQDDGLYQQLLFSPQNSFLLVFDEFVVLLEEHSLVG